MFMHNIPKIVLFAVLSFSLNAFAVTSQELVQLINNSEVSIEETQDQELVKAALEMVPNAYENRYGEDFDMALYLEHAYGFESLTDQMIIEFFNTNEKCQSMSEDFWYSKVDDFRVNVSAKKDGSQNFVVSKVVSKESQETLALEVQPMIQIDVTLAGNEGEEAKKISCTGPFIISVDNLSGGQTIDQSIFLSLNSDGLEFIGYNDDIFYVFVETILAPYIEEQEAENQRQIALKDTI